MLFCRCTLTEGLYPRGCEAGAGPDGGPGLGTPGAARTGLMDGLRVRSLGVAEALQKKKMKRETRSNSTEQN